MRDANAALFVMLGQLAEKQLGEHPDLVPPNRLMLSSTTDLASLVPDKVRRSMEAAEAYQLFFVFESYLREFVVEVLSRDEGTSWWEKVPRDIQEEISRLEEKEGDKAWMALGSRDKSALMTLPQLLKTIDSCWKEGFDELVRDKALVQEARLLIHLRNTVCHMSPVSPEEKERIRQTLRDWFRAVSP